MKNVLGKTISNQNQKIHQKTYIRIPYTRNWVKHGEITALKSHHDTTEQQTTLQDRARHAGPAVQGREV